MLPTGFTDMEKILWKRLPLLQVFHRGRWRERVAAGCTCFPGNPCIPVMYKTGRADVLFAPGGIGAGFFGVLHGNTLGRTDLHACPAPDTVLCRPVERCSNFLTGSMAAEGNGMGTDVLAAHVHTEAAEDALFVFKGEAGDSYSHLICQLPYNLHVG